jgi:hypothetical protein
MSRKKRLLTEMIMQWFSLTAPQHPKNATMKMTTPITIRRSGATKNFPSTNGRYLE